jgi:hypothetical protein
MQAALLSLGFHIGCSVCGARLPCLALLFKRAADAGRIAGSGVLN